jgi:hypothetical protein
MAFRYDLPPSSFPLRQGEIIQNLQEVVPDASGNDSLTDATQRIAAYQIEHPFAIIVSQDCDLTQDCRARAQPNPKLDTLLVHIQFCELFPAYEIKDRGMDSKEWRQVKGNKLARYHHMDEASIGSDEQSTVPDLCADFKRTFSLDVAYTYWLVSSGAAVRKATVPDPYLRDFIHRLHSFLSRVPLPDDADMELPPGNWLERFIRRLRYPTNK